MSSFRGRSSGFSLGEVLASMVVLTIAAIAVTAIWKLADEKALMARLDDRAGRLLREYYELETFAPEYLFGDRISASSAEEAGIPLRPGEARRGFLYHPKERSSIGGSAEFADQIPYQIALDTQGQILTLTYHRNTVSMEEATIMRTVVLYPRHEP